MEENTEGVEEVGNPSSSDAEVNTEQPLSTNELIIETNNNKPCCICFDDFENSKIHGVCCGNGHFLCNNDLEKVRTNDLSLQYP